MIEIKAAIVISTLDACKPLQIMGYTMNYSHQPVGLTVPRNSSISRTVDSDSLVVFLQAWPTLGVETFPSAATLIAIVKHLRSKDEISHEVHGQGSWRLANKLNHLICEVITQVTGWGPSGLN